MLHRIPLAIVSTAPLSLFYNCNLHHFSFYYLLLLIFVLKWKTQLIDDFVFFRQRNEKKLSRFVYHLTINVR